MDRYRRPLLVLWIGAAVIVAMLLIPPWTCTSRASSISAGYSFVFAPPYEAGWAAASIDWGRLIAQVIATAALFLLLAVMFVRSKDWKPKPRVTWRQWFKEERAAWTATLGGRRQAISAVLMCATVICGGLFAGGWYLGNQDRLGRERPEWAEGWKRSLVDIRQEDLNMGEFAELDLRQSHPEVDWNAIMKEVRAECDARDAASPWAPILAKVNGPPKAKAK